MSDFGFLKTTQFAEKIKKNISDRKDKKTFYQRLRLFITDGRLSISRNELEMFETEYNQCDKNLRAYIRESKSKLK